MEGFVVNDPVRCWRKTITEKAEPTRPTTTTTITAAATATKKSKGNYWSESVWETRKESATTERTKW